MIQYDFGKWGIQFIFRITGSVFPVAVVFALPCALLSLFLHVYFNNDIATKPDIDGAKNLYSNYCFVLGFLLVFRTQIAYSRFWEGGSILQDMRSSWLNVTSSLVAFTTDNTSRRDEVDRFLNLLVRLMSMMHCSALQEVVDMQDENFDIISCDGIDEESMRYLVALDSAKRVEVILQWIQRLIVTNQGSGVVSSPAPIVSRVFQELADGRMSFNAAKKIAQFPFPFPYAQMLMVMLMIHWCVAPFMAALLVDDITTCVISTFVTSLAFWAINYIAAELEMPFGDNPNDLPLKELQVYFNDSLGLLMNPSVQGQPVFDYRRDLHSHMAYKKMAAVEAHFLGTQIAKPLTYKKRNTLRLSQAAMSKETGDSSPIPSVIASPLSRSVAVSPDANREPKAIQSSVQTEQSNSSVVKQTNPDANSSAVSQAAETSNAARERPSLEEWDAVVRIERLTKLVQELVHVSGNLVQGFSHHTRHWAASPEAAGLSLPHGSVDPELLQSARAEDPEQCLDASTLSLADSSERLNRQGPDRGVLAM